MRTIKQPEPEQVKRMNLNVPIELHNSLQVAHRRPGAEHDRRAAGVHPGLCRQALVLEAERAAQVKRAALYMRVSSVDQHPETQLLRPAPDGRPARLRDRQGVYRPDQRRQGAPPGPGRADAAMPAAAASMWSWSGPRTGSPGR